MRQYKEYLVPGEKFEMGLNEAQTIIIQGEIGSGGFGIVWRANHPRTTREYAVKHINIPKLVDEGRIERENTPLLIRRIEREASINVSSEYVVGCYGFREIRGNYFLLSDYVPGDSLRFWLRFHAGASWKLKKEIYLNILQGVRALHQAGIVHRDLKPSNILLSSERKIPKIIDFGLVKLDDSADTMSGDFSGSQFYQDPALIQGMEGIKYGDRDSDVFALGILLYELIVGKNPWQANNLRYQGLFEQIKGKKHVLDLDRQFQLDAPPEEVTAVRKAIERSTCFERSERLQSVDEMLALLRGTRETSATGSRPETPPTRVQPSPIAPKMPEIRVSSPEKTAPGKPRRRLFRAGNLLILLLLGAGMTVPWFLGDLDEIWENLKARWENSVTPTPTAVPERQTPSAPEAQATVSPQPTQAQMVAVEPSPTPKPTVTPSPAPTATSTPMPTETPSPEPTFTPTPMPTATPSPEPTATPSPEPTATPTPEPTATPSPQPTATPTPNPTATPMPTETPGPNVGALLKEAGEYMDRKWYLSDKNGKESEQTAFSVYRRILEYDPQHIGAYEGLSKMADTYKTWADGFFYESGDSAKSKTYYENYHNVTSYMLTLRDDPQREHDLKEQQARVKVRIHRVSVTSDGR